VKVVTKFITAFIFIFILYFLLSNSFNIEELIAALSLSCIIGIFFAKLVPLELKYLNPIRLYWFIVYIPFFVLEMIKANLQIAGIVVNPGLPINPGIIRGKTKLKSAIGRLLLTSSITLTPGTLSVDIDDDEVAIHCVVVKENADLIISKFEKYIKRITE
jgi:multicomponent Na+:H+ antiporter subunit E